jgi:hypothetical protein
MHAPINEQLKSIPPLWMWIVMLSCIAIIASGALTLVGWIGLALLGY